MASIRQLCMVCIAFSIPALVAQDAIPAWCRALPRRENVGLVRVITGGWFEVYRVAPGVFAIYEPHQSEETISYLIVGQTKALLFDTGMGIGNIQHATAELTRLPIVVLNSHTHVDHVGGNWQFDTILAMDADFTPANARGSREAAQAEIAPGETCGERFRP
ncbi:MAG TPA: MBL fold metallo-hydrolase [Bryobacteraceae bacterium]|jgi:glyoxylase-like metal-dependent hydrolase (beta-lactamase superfamily II)|nr:MBL fold metallo-hydrolase [Bryobacteraceae bacterium]